MTDKNQSRRERAYAHLAALLKKIVAFSLSTALLHTSPLCGKECPCETPKTESNLYFSQEEWNKIGNIFEYDEDLIILNDGTRLWGCLEKIPAITYSYGKVNFERQEAAALAFYMNPERPRMQVLTRNGQLFIGKMPTKNLSFRRWLPPSPDGITQEEHAEKIYTPIELLPTSIQYIFIKPEDNAPALLNEHYLSLILVNGDRFPITAENTKIQLSDGWNEFTINPLDIIHLRYRSGLQGRMKGKALDAELPFSFVKDRYFFIQLAKNGQRLKIPWNQVDEIIADKGQFIQSSPYFIQSWISEDMIYIPPGKFSFGAESVSTKDKNISPAVQAALVGSKSQLPSDILLNKENIPQKNYQNREKQLTGFFIDKYEVTNASYAQFVEATSHRAPVHWPEGKVPIGLERYPVVNVSYKDALAYASWAGKRLPTEEEWERAAKGISSLRYPYGQEYSPTLSNTNNTTVLPVGTYEDAGIKAQQEAQVPINEIQDMSGNASEWTTSTFDNSRTKSLSSHESNSQDPSLFKVIRGGSYLSSAESCTTCYRARMHVDDFNAWTGFRCAKDASPELKSWQRDPSQNQE